MKKSCCFLLVFSLNLLALAQPDGGKPSVAELQMKSCSFEPDAPAMKMADIQNINFSIFLTGTKVKTERRVRIKIFNEKGYQYATIKIPYFSKKGVAKIRELSGVVYNLDENGKVVSQKLEKRDFFKEKAIENVGVVRFTFPNIRPGSIVEYSYTTVENNILSIPPWIIQGEMPVAYTSISIVAPNTASLEEMAIGTDTLEYDMGLMKSDLFRMTTYIKRNVRSFQPEPFMSSYNDHLMKVVFRLFPHGMPFHTSGSANSFFWALAGRVLLQSEYFKKQVGSVIPGTESLIDSAKKILLLSDRINFIYTAVQRRWVGKAEQTTRLEDLAEAWKDRSGTTSEINLILLNLLEKANIKCVPLLISTRENGKINKSFPSLGQLNGIDVMAFDSTGYYLLDASMKYQTFHTPPINILNREAFVLTPDSMQWVTVTDNRPLMKESVSVLADLKEDGKLEGSANIQYFDYAKSYKLDTALWMDTDEKKSLDKKPAGLKILSAKLDTTDNPSDPLFETVEFVYEPQQTNEFYFIRPQFLLVDNKNPFPAEKRNTDIDFGCNQLQVFTMEIFLNGKFSVDALPKNFTLRAPDSSFFFKAVYSATAERVSVSQIFESKKSVFAAADYKGLQDFFRQMLTLREEEIILKKKK